MDTYYKGDKVKAIVGVSNETDGTTGDYVIDVILKDVDSVEYILQKDSSGNFSYAKKSALGINLFKVKESMTVGTCYTFNYTAELPDMAEGDVQAKVEIYDDTGSTFIIGTEYTNVFTFKKKKFHLSSLALEFQSP